jgi:HlyD family secretion protein
MIRRLVIAAIVLLVAVLAALALRPAPVEVETAVADRGPLAEAVEGIGHTRVRERFDVTAPVAGELLRVTVHPGDAVMAGQVVARVAPPASPPLDARTRSEATARLAAAQGAEAEATAALARARVAAGQGERDLDRARELARQGSTASADAEAAEAAARVRAEEARMAGAALLRAGAEVAAARAALQTGGPGGRTVEVRAPARGMVLRVPRESGGPVAAGTPLVEVGDVAALEVVVDLPTADAVRVRPGQAARLTGWGGSAVLEARVRLVEPGAFTKVSPLGVEEQRVNVLLDPRGPGWDALGDGYAADVAVVVREHADAVRVPSSALFSAAGGDALFLVDGGRARLVRVEVAGRAAGLAALARGLEPGARVVVHPGDQVADGVRVRSR